MSLSVLFLPVLLAVLVATPITRGGVIWVITAIIAPPVLYFRHRWDNTLQARAITSHAAADITARRLQGFAELGFTPRGTFAIENADGYSTVLIEVLVHEATRAVASISRTVVRGTAIRVTSEVRLEGTWGTIAATDTALGRDLPPESISSRRAEFPSLLRSAWLCEAHQAMVRHAGNPQAAPLPESPEQWARKITDDRLRMLERTTAAHITTLPSRRGIRRLTLRSCFARTFDSLWPRKQRLFEQAIQRERQTLHDLGLAHLVEEAARAPENIARARSASAPTSVTIPDDRAVARSVATPAALKTDDRRHDPRFAAVLAQSQSARQGQYRSVGGWFVVAMVVAILGPLFLGVPLWLVVPVVLFTSILATTVRNAGKAHAAEQAAANRLIRRGLCASCLYGLAGLPIESDGCRICPECGAAWRQARILEFAVFSNAHDGDPSLKSHIQRAADVVGFRQAYLRGGLRAKDHRRQPQTLISPRLQAELTALPERDSSDFGVRLQTAHAKMSRSGRWVRWLVAPFAALTFIGLPLLTLGTILIRSGGALGFQLIPLLVGPVFGGMMVYGILRGNFGYRPRAIITAMLESNMCPCCADDLAARTPGADGCVECECGAAWRMAPPMTPRAIARTAH